MSDKTVGDYLGETVRDNLRFLVLGGIAAYFLGSYFGLIPSIPTIPLWVQAAATFAVVGALAGWAAYQAGDPEEDKEWIHLYEIDATRDDYLAHWKLSPEKFERLETFGTLVQHQSAPDQPLECRYYDPENDLAIATWRGMVADSTLVSKMDEIAELREENEREIRKYKAIRSALPSIVRRLDKRRAERQRQVREKHVTPDMDGETIDEIIEEALPDDAVPEHIRSDGDDHDRDPGASATVEVDGEYEDAIEDLDYVTNGGIDP